MSYSDDNSFEKILDRALNRKVLANVDKRVGSIIYDALAPVCMELADVYIKMDILEEQCYLMTATSSNLDKRVYDYGIARKSATYAYRIAEFKKYKTDDDGNYVYNEDGEKILVDMDISTGARFAVPNDSSTTFVYMGKTDGNHILKCEQAGSKGNSHAGIILPLTPIASLVEAKITSTLTPGEDEEDDETLRARTKQHLNYTAYGGNISDYINKVNALDGVGQTKVFPAWQHNGSVLLSVVSPTFDPISVEFAQNLKNQIDPEEESGQGVGFAPIGHFVTVTTPITKIVDVSMNLETEFGTDVGEVYEAIVSTLEAYFLSERQKFSQNVRLAIYRSRIIEKVLNAVPKIMNVTDLLLNGEDSDIVYNDEGLIGMQYLPYVGTVTVDGNSGENE